MTVSKAVASLKQLPSHPRNKRKRDRDDTQLVEDIASLRRQIQALELVQAIHNKLLDLSASTRGNMAQCILHHSSGSISARTALGDSIQQDPSPANQEGDRICLQQHGLHQSRYRVTNIQVLGCPDAPIVRIDGVVCGMYSPQQIEAIYKRAPGNILVLDKLLDRQVEYATSSTFFFSADGTLERQIIETDAVKVFHAITGTLSIATQSAAANWTTD